MGETSEDNRHNGAAPNDAASDADGVPASNPRQNATVRDMVFSLLVLLAVIGVIVMMTRGCEFSPGRPTVDEGAAPTVDARAELRRMADRVEFPLRRPEPPAGWRANSARTAQLGSGERAAVLAEIGWLTGAGRYVQLVQSPASARRLVDEIARRDGAGESPTGSVRVRDVSWHVYPARPGEQAWVGTFDGVRIVISGSATPAELRALAEAIQAAKPLPTS
ncbi:MAG: DUF4245 family protein [Pseudonocardiaceae bacterium]|nr:DUF4245 family protein [Pseudonocardiaceae bacterium]